MKKLLLLFTFLVLANYSYAQTIGGSTPTYNLPVIVPPTPEVASLLKFSETPVSYHTGIPNVSIPIANINSGELSSSVSISYHAGGHRVNEESSWVGLGWSLSAGGQITRTVRGIPDDSQTYGYINTQYTVESTLQECSSVVSQECKDRTYANGSIAKTNDYEPDEFSFSGMGISGRFMFDQIRDNTSYGRIIQFEGRGVKITPVFGQIDTQSTSSKIIEWNIVDNNGNIYNYIKGNIFVRSQYFPIKNGQIELCDECGSGESYIETWNLKSVTSLTGHTIEFEYNRPVVTNMSGRNEINYSIGEQKILIYSATSSGSTSTNIPNSTFPRTSSYVETQRSFTQISKIIAKQGTEELGSIEFNTSLLPRSDTQSTKYALNNIILKDKFGNNIKKANLLQGYFQSSASTQNGFMNHTSMAFNIDTNSFLKRLYLQKVEFEEIVDPNTFTPKTYSYDFLYNTSEMLPGKHSYAQDHWGYYNGFNNNQSLVPPLSGLSLPTTGNRSVVPDFTDACILKEIVFPEGGKTVFNYGNNTKGTVDLGNGIRSTFFQLDANPTINHTISYNGNNTTYTFEREFIIANNAVSISQSNSSVLMQYDGFTSACEDNDALYLGDSVCNRMFFRIYREGSSTPAVSKPIWQSGELIVNKGEKIKVEIEITTQENDIGGGNTFLDYDITQDIAFVKLNYNILVDFGSLEDYMGGLRIADIKNYDNTGDLLTHKYYQYENGYTLSKPTYLRNTILRQQDGMGDSQFLDQDYQTIELVSQSWIPLVSTQAKYQGYEKVREIFNKVQNGEGIFSIGIPTNTEHQQVITRTYNIPGGFSNIFPGAPYEPLVDRNNLKSENISDKKITTNNYSITSFRSSEFLWGYKLSSSSSIDNFHPSLLSSGFSIISGGGTNNTIQCGQYGDCQLSGSLYQIAPSINLLSKQTIDIVEEQKIMTQVTENFYSSIPNHYNPTSIISTGSDGKVTEQKMSYPLESSNTRLLEENKINTLLETITIKDSIILQRVKTDYAIDQGNYLPKTIKALKSQDTITGNISVIPELEERLIYHGYYSNGNIQEVSKKDGTHVVYIWGYNQTSPIAKIENATYSQVSSYVANLENLSNLDNDRTIGSNGNEGALRVALSNLRASLTYAMVTTFTYDPLIGVTSVTDPRGNTSYYSYDGFNRLQYIKDYQGNILSENQYNYKN